MAKPTEEHRIRIDGIEVNAPVGFYPEERKKGIDFLINIELITDFSGTAAADDMASTLNYESLIAVIKTEMAIPAKLIENAAHRIKKELLRLYPGLPYLRLELKKQHPALELKTASATIIIEYLNELSAPKSGSY